VNDDTATAARAGAQDISTSNSLADLAARIRAEHEASALHVKRGLDHAIACGRLLLEAKAGPVGQHGQWLPWLREHCGVPERSARRYMEIAAYAAEGKSANLADMADSALDGAAEATPSLASIAEALEAEDWKTAGDFAVRRYLDSPFAAWDFDFEDEAFDWVGYKLRHRLKVPTIAEWCFDVAKFAPDGRPPLRLCPWDELLDALKALAPVVNAKRNGQSQPIKFNCESFDSMTALQDAITTIELVASWSIGGILKELEHRDKITEEQYSKEWDETHQHVMARLHQKVADLERERVSRAEHAEVVS
jgi:hypothetical protein